jgi:hypothetical protein
MFKNLDGLFMDFPLKIAPFLIPYVTILSVFKHFPELPTIIVNVISSVLLARFGWSLVRPISSTNILTHA